MSDLSDYERRQETEAIISIDELIKKSNSSKKEPTKEKSSDDFLKKLKTVQKNLDRNSK